MSHSPLGYDSTPAAPTPDPLHAPLSTRAVILASLVAGLALAGLGAAGLLLVAVLPTEARHRILTLTGITSDQFVMMMATDDWQRVLDMGALGVMVPYVSTVAETRAAVQAMQVLPGSVTMVHQGLVSTGGSGN